MHPLLYPSGLPSHIWRRNKKKGNREETFPPLRWQPKVWENRIYKVVGYAVAAAGPAKVVRKRSLVLLVGSKDFRHAWKNGRQGRRTLIPFCVAAAQAN